MRIKIFKKKKNLKKIKKSGRGGAPPAETKTQKFSEPFSPARPLPGHTCRKIIFAFFPKFHLL
jgi:hypothetical protein